MAMPATNRVPTPRPSISPLSTASRANPDSPTATRAVPILAQDGVFHHTAEVDDEPDDRSSSLSDPEDDQDDEPGVNGAIHNALQTAQQEVQRILDDDSEAETERLDHTPQKLSRHADSMGRTPSKLSQAATMDDELSDPPSPLPIGVGAASSTSTIGTAGTKRKRSEPVESPLTSAESDLGESPRKRSHDPPSNTDAPDDGDSGAAERDLAKDDPPTDTTTKALKGRRGGRPKGSKRKGFVEETAVAVEDALVLEEELSEETMAKTEEGEQHKTEATSSFEELAKQFAALREKLYSERLDTMAAELEMLEKPNSVHPEYLRQVASVNARLEKQTREAHAFYNYKLHSIRERTIGERSQLHSQYFQHVRQMREDVLDELGRDWYNIQQERRRSNQEQDEAYTLKFQDQKSIQIRQQAKYNQEVSVLSGVAKYVGFPAAPEIDGTRSEDLDDDLRAMRVVLSHDTVVNAGTGASQIPGRALSTKNSIQPPVMAVPRAGIQSITSQNERLAHEQFIEQNAWARPQASIHNYGTPGLKHTPDWAEPQSSARNFVRTLGAQAQQTLSPFATPMPQKWGPGEHYSSAGTVGVDSDGLEPPSSVVAAPPTTDRIQQSSAGDTFASSPLQVMKPRQHQQQQQQQSNGHDLTGYRNISGISGTSTIDAPQDNNQNWEAPPPHPWQKDVSGLDAMRPSDEDKREVQPNGGFRPAESAYGNPAPLPGPT